VQEDLYSRPKTSKKGEGRKVTGNTTAETSEAGDRGEQQTLRPAAVVSSAASGAPAQRRDPLGEGEG
jgi:hypothetical protein